MRDEYKPLAAFLFMITLPFGAIFIFSYNLLLGIIAFACLVGIVEWLLSDKSRPKAPELKVEEKHDKIYQDVYINEIAPYEKKRKIRGWRERFIRIMLVLSAVATITGFGLTVTEDDKYALIMFLSFIIFVTFARIGTGDGGKFKPKENNRFLDVVLPMFIQRMVPGLDFNYAYREIKTKLGRELEMVHQMLDHKEFNLEKEDELDYNLIVDYDFGWIEDNNIIKKMYNIHEERTVETSERPITVMTDALFGWEDIREYGSSVIKITPNRNFKYIETEDKVEKYLKIWIENDLGIYIQRDILEYLANLYETTGIDFEIRIKDGKIFYIFPKDKDTAMYNLNKEEYKKFLFSYYYAVRTMMDISKLIRK